MSTIAEKQLQTARALIDGYNSFTTVGPDGIFGHRSADCVQESLPASMQDPPRSNAEYEKVLGAAFRNLKNFKVRTAAFVDRASASRWLTRSYLLQIAIHKIVNDPEQHMAVVHASASAETAWAPYHNEYAIFLTFDGTGEKVVKVEEFTDSQFMADFSGRMRAHFKAQG